jgi:hypothetical protein
MKKRYYKLFGKNSLTSCHFNEIFIRLQGQIEILRHKLTMSKIEKWTTDSDKRQNLFLIDLYLTNSRRLFDDKSTFIRR